MSNPEQAGHTAIAEAVTRVGTPAIVVEMHRQFGDVLHSTLVVRHLRVTSAAKVVWAICERYVDAFRYFVVTQHGPHAVAALPELPKFPEDGPTRVAWVRRAQEIPGVQAIGCGVHPWGWRHGNIVDAVLNNAGIKALAVPRRPWLPLAHNDLVFADRLISSRALHAGFVALEYTSYSLATNNLAWYTDLIQRLRFPVIALAGANEPLPEGAIDGRGTTFRQAKALIMRASCFVGCGSGLSIVAASNHCEQPVVELVTPALSMPEIGYRSADHHYRNMHGASASEVARAVQQLISRLRPAH